MSDLKFRYVYSNGKEIKSFIYTIEEIEKKILFLSYDFKLISRDRFTGLKDKNIKNQVEVFEHDKVVLLSGEIGVVEWDYRVTGWVIILDNYKKLNLVDCLLCDVLVISNTHIEALKEKQ